MLADMRAVERQWKNNRLVSVRRNAAQRGLVADPCYIGVYRARACIQAWPLDWTQGTMEPGTGKRQQRGRQFVALSV